MRVIEDAWKAADRDGGAVGTIGNFDGLHLGQRAVLDRLIERARETALPSVLVTFEPHPLAVLRAEGAPRRLTTRPQKLALLETLGIDTVAEIRFTDEFSTTPAEVFVRDFLLAKLGLREIIVGCGFAFGHHREGDLAFLSTLAPKLGFECLGVEEVLHEGEPISSTRIRRAVAAGEVDAASAMLGRSYAVSGSVVRGDGRGKDLGWPTINLALTSEIVPADGVYAARVKLSGTGDQLDGVTNVGFRPTFDGSAERVVECHIFDFDLEVYGQTVELSFVKRLREERAFSSAEALVEQIAEDARRAREYLASESC